VPPSGALLSRLRGDDLELPPGAETTAPEPAAPPAIPAEAGHGAARRRLARLSGRSMRSLQIALLAAGTLLVALGFILLPGAFRGRVSDARARLSPASVVIPYAAAQPTSAPSPATRVDIQALLAAHAEDPTLPAAVEEPAAEPPRAPATLRPPAAPASRKRSPRPERQKSGASVFDAPIAPPEQ